MRLYILIGIVLVLFACGQTNDSTDTGNEVETNYMKANGYDIPVYHGFLEIYDTIQNSNTKHFIDSMGYALQEKFFFVDARNEIRGTMNPDEINLERMNPNFPYILQTHVKGAPAEGNYQVIKVHFMSDTQPFITRTRRIKAFTGGGVPNTTFFADCADPTIGCNIKYNLKRIAKMFFE